MGIRKERGDACSEAGAREDAVEPRRGKHGPPLKRSMGRLTDTRWFLAILAQHMRDEAARIGRHRRLALERVWH